MQISHLQPLPLPPWCSIYPCSCICSMPWNVAALPTSKASGGALHKMQDFRGFCATQEPGFRAVPVIFSLQSRHRARGSASHLKWSLLVIAWGKGLSRRKYPQMTLSFPGGTLGSIRWKQAGIASLRPDLLETRSGCWPLGKRKKNISETSLSCLGSSSAFLCQTTASRPTFCVFGLSRALVIYLHNLEMPPSIGSPVLAVLPQAPKEDINSSHHPEGCS